MPMPMEYQRASEEFEKFLADARDRAGLATRNQTYTMVQAVLLTFRHRLSIESAITFAAVLPPILRAIFVVDWDLSKPPRPFGSREAMTTEVQQFRGDHNFSPRSAISDVAGALWSAVDRNEFESCLAKLGPEASAFWRTASSSGS